MKEAYCQLCHTAISNLSVRSGKLTILNDVSINIPCGQTTAVIGQNGVGKSTLLRAILKQVKYSGDISFFDHDNGSRMTPRIGYVPQNFECDKSAPVTVADFMGSALARRPVWLGIGAKTKARITALLNSVECGYIYSRRIGELSGGELQRMLLSLSLEPLPDLLILDEPVSGVDRKGLEMFYALVNRLRRDHHIAILLVSHDLDLVYHFADNVVLLDKTALTQGTPDEVYNSIQFSGVFGHMRHGTERT